MSKDEIYLLFDNIINQKKKKSTSKASDIDEERESLISDKEFEIKLRDILENSIPISKLDDKILDESKEFQLFKMDIFNRKTKDLLNSKSFSYKERYCYINKGKEQFFVCIDDLSKLYFRNTENDEVEEVQGFEETQQTSNDTTKFFLKENEEKDIIRETKKENETFFDEIKFNLISKETISFIGQNNNISPDILNDYYVKAKLLSKGNHPYMICLGKDKEYQPGSGKIHYPMEKYYIKLNSIKGQFDGAYRVLGEFNINKFGCDIIYTNISNIAKDSIILFEFKNGNSGENKVISQANKYQENAKVIFGDEDFYHIIIIRSEKLGDSLSGKKKQIEEKKFTNFAILGLKNQLRICQENLNIAKRKKINPKSKNSKSSQQGTDISRLEEELKDMKNEIKDMKNDIKNNLDLINKTLENINSRLNEKLKYS